MALNKIPKLLLECLSTLNHDFNTSTYLEEFGALETNLERVNFVYKDMEKHNLFFKFVKDEKNDQEARRLRELGDELFASKDYRGALNMYTLSIKTAASKDVLAVAYANRSACLYKLDMFRECVTDIERAVVNDYPAEKRPKLIERRKQAAKLQKPSRKSYESIPRIPARHKNALIDCAGDCIKIACSEGFGRHIVATRDVQIGEVLCVERPYSWMLTENPLIHCHECVELCYNPIPCPSCTQVSYCGESCRERARSKYHERECAILKSLDEYGMSRVTLALKTTILAMDHFDHLDTFKFDQNEEYRSDRYKEVHCLLSGAKNRSVMDLFFKAVLAASTFKFLKTTTRFSQNVAGKFKELLLLQLQVHANNAVAIYEQITGLCEFSQGKIGAGLYSFSSLFNHSCCHNVERFHCGSTMVMRASASIKKGQQCFINYGCHYGHDSKIERQMTLAFRYFFECKCRACEENWRPNLISFPLHMELEMQPLQFHVSYLRICNGDAAVAKWLIQRLKSALEDCEEREPMGGAFRLKEVLRRCFRALGNKRKLIVNCS